MRQLAILTFVTIDGVMQAPMMPEEDRSGGFAHGGWAAPYYQDVMAQVQKEAMAEPYDILFGRKTYEVFADHWPNADRNDPTAKRMNDARKYVATSTLTELAWSNAELLNGDIATAVQRIKEMDGPLLQVHGSWQLIQALHAHGLIDEYRLWTFPVIVGSGKRLFDNGAAPTGARLVKSEACKNGVVMSIFSRTA